LIGGLSAFVALNRRLLQRDSFAEMATSLICTTLLLFDQARTEIISMSGTQYGPAAVQAF
jgi:hypothetical protein